MSVRERHDAVFSEGRFLVPFAGSTEPAKPRDRIADFVFRRALGVGDNVPRNRVAGKLVRAVIDFGKHVHGNGRVAVHVGTYDPRIAVGETGVAGENFGKFRDVIRLIFFRVGAFVRDDFAVLSQRNDRLRDAAQIALRAHLTGFVHCHRDPGGREPGEDADNRDDGEQLDEREAFALFFKEFFHWGTLWSIRVKNWRNANPNGRFCKPKMRGRRVPAKLRLRRKLCPRRSPSLLTLSLTSLYLY